MARGTVKIWEGRTVTTLVADSDAANAECAPGSGVLVQLEVAFQNAAGRRALLTIRPRLTEDVHGWLPADFVLIVDGREPLVGDGAILVVSAADGPGP